LPHEAPVPRPTPTWRSAFDAVDGAPDAGAALDALRGKTSAPTTLVKALNLMRSTSTPTAPRISADSRRSSPRPPRHQGAPAGTRIEVGGHTDNTGDAAANMKLSQDARRRGRELVADGVDPANLTSKGYGQDKPIADNNTEKAGRRTGGWSSRSCV
jgi:hypothetical protein